jgi:hypothetical protein
MKKILSALTVFAVMAAMVLGMTVEAAASGSLTGPDSVKQGSAFTVSFVINATDCKGINASLSFNSSELTLNSIKDSSGANVDYKNGTLFLDTMSNPINGSAKILDINFTATGAVGAKSTITLSDISITENYTEVSVNNVSHTVTIAESTSASSSSSSSSAGSKPNTTTPSNTSSSGTSTNTSSVTSKPAAANTNTSKQQTAESSAPVVSSSEQSVVSKVTSTQVSEQPKTSDKGDNSKDDGLTETPKNKSWVFIAISGLLLGGAIGVLIYIKWLKPEEE